MGGGVGRGGEYGVGGDDGESGAQGDGQAGAGGVEGEGGSDGATGWLGGSAVETAAIALRMGSSDGSDGGGDGGGGDDGADGGGEGGGGEGGGEVGGDGAVCAEICSRTQVMVTRRRSIGPFIFGCGWGAGVDVELGRDGDRRTRRRTCLVFLRNPDCGRFLHEAVGGAAIPR